MKKHIALVFGMLAVPAFAEVAPVYYDDIYEYSDNGVVGVEEQRGIVYEETQPAAPENVTPAANVNVKPNPRANITRVANRSGANAAPTGRASTPSPSRAITARATVAPGRNEASAPSAQRNAATNAPNVARAGAAPLYNPTSAARIGVRAPVAYAAGSRISTARNASVTGGTTASEPIATGPTMEEIAQLTDFCKAQYFQCMDGFCDILDDNQGRCSCSANITKYAKSEKALKDATEELQNIAMKIQYIGLTKDEVISLFSNTEAEAAMAGRTDTTQLRQDLNKVQKMVLDIKTTNSFVSESVLGLDFSQLMDFNLVDNFDLSTLFTGGSSVSNQRGAELYKTASARCRSSVLEGCRKQGIDINLIANAYDLEIDRQCIIYERSLEDANTNMRRTVRNATNVLQKARLVVAQNRNTYDARGCINALDACMQNDFVCGTDFEGCMDPTGKFIVNGQIVIGSQPGVFNPTPTSKVTGLYAAWNFGGGQSFAWSQNTTGVTGSLSELVKTITSWNKQSGNDMLSFLLYKIGYHTDNDGKNYGMCMSVLNKCQDVTYTGSGGKYKIDNDIVREFLTRSMQLIKARQDALISSHAESCMSDVTSCLISNRAIMGSQIDGAYAGSIPSSSFNACKPTITTCASVLGLIEEHGIDKGINMLVRDAVCFSNAELTVKPTGDRSCGCDLSTHKACATGAMAGFCIPNTDDCQSGCSAGKNLCTEGPSAGQCVMGVITDTNCPCSSGQSRCTNGPDIGMCRPGLSETGCACPTGKVRCPIGSDFPGSCITGTIELNCYNP